MEKVCRACSSVYWARSSYSFFCSIDCTFAFHTATGEGGCIEWKSTYYANGYGMLRFGGRRMRAHRFAWEQAHGRIPDGLLVRHSCDNRRCVTVAHLSLGRHIDNSADTVSRNRQMRGERCWKSRLTESDVRLIKGRLRSDEPSRSIASDYSVNERVIGAIKQGKNWKWVD